jgi:hypothetical protein
MVSAYANSYADATVYPNIPVGLPKQCIFSPGLDLAFPGEWSLGLDTTRFGKTVKLDIGCSDVAFGLENTNLPINEYPEPCRI